LAGETSGRVRIPLQTIYLPPTGRMLSGNSPIWEKRLGIPHVARRWGTQPYPCEFEIEEILTLKAGR
jgi:hypothetical protein